MLRPPAPSQPSRIKSEQLAILNETRSLRHLVIEDAGGRVALLREPIHTACTALARIFFHSVDQGPADTKITRIRSDEQILQVAVITDCPARAVKQIVHDAGKLAVDVSAEQKHRLGRVM